MPTRQHTLARPCEYCQFDSPRTGDDVLEESLSHLQAATKAWTGNDTRVLHVTTAQVNSDEPAIAAAAHEGVTVFGDTSWLRRSVRRQASDAS